MPFNAEGKWIPEDQSTAKQLNGLLSSDSKYIKQARYQGEKTAASRGLQNSSMAAGASEASAIAAAAPIASQDASQIAAQNLQSSDLNSRENLLNTELDSREKLLNTELNSRANLLDTELASRSDLAAKDITSRYTLQQMSDTAANLRQKLQIEGSLTAQEKSDLAAMDRQMEALSSQERQALLSSETQLRGQQIASDSNLSSNYLSAMGSLSSNPDISAADRNAYIAEFQRVTNQGRAYMDTLGATQLSWGGSTTNGGGPAAPTAPSSGAPSPAPTYPGNIANLPPTSSGVNFGSGGVYGGPEAIDLSQYGMVYKNGKWTAIQ